MNYILFDSQTDRLNLMPFTYTRPVSEIRCGILTLAEKWKHYLQATPSYLTAGYLQEKFSLKQADVNTFILSSVFPHPELVQEIKQLKTGQGLYANGLMIAFCAAEFAEHESMEKIESAQSHILKLSYNYDIFAKNGEALISDYQLLTAGRKTQPISSTNQVLNPDQIFIEPGAKVEFAILNASTGPIYIGKDAEIMEGSMVRGPFAMCEHAGLKMDAKVYGPTTLGPHCKAGGELNNVVMFGYSNKGHDGFLGNAVIGEWCNLGADTNNSNLKNTYEEVKLWNYRTERFEKTGLTFCGLMMADHAKCGINTMFNTGTVVGVGANIFGAGFPRNFIPSFAWGGAQGFETFMLNKFYKTAEAMCARRQVQFGEVDIKILKAVFESSAKYRFWENQSTNQS
jgi:UDP-N-acetylglucosamine diphosphorylase/glucosamine-1-phosphate N-acetyltransferase